MSTALSFTLLAAVAAITVPRAPAAQFLVVTRSADGAWSLQPAESVAVNGKDKVRRGPASGGPATFDSKSVGRLAAAEIGAFSVIRRAPDGTFFGRSGVLPDWQLVLPDGAKSQAPQSAAGLWTGATVALARDRKDRTLAAVRIEELYAIIPGPDPAASAAALATDTDLHKVPGVDDAQAFQQMLALLPHAVKAFPTGAAADKMREHVRASMAARLDTWLDGDAALAVLDECLALANASEAAFAGDASQTELRKRAREARKWLDRRVAILRALDAGKQSDAFLLAYRDFEVFDKSFKDLSDARRVHLKASAADHLKAGQQSHRAGDYGNAIRHLRIAQWRDPQFVEAVNLLEQVRLEVARLSSQKFAEMRAGLDPRAPKQVQIQRRLSMADQYLNDGKLLEAEQALREAETVDKDEPKIKLMEARLAVLRGDLGRALALLDYYAGVAVTPQDFDEGEKLRASVQYKLENSRKETHGQLTSLVPEQQFGATLETAAGGLKLDNEDGQFLYQAGLAACVLRLCQNASPLLHRFLDITDSTQGKREHRIAVMRLLRQSARAVERRGPAQAASAVSWFSGAPLEPGVFYDPVSLAFQPKVASVKGSNHLAVSYDWSGDQIRSVHTKYEDKKTGTNVLKVIAAGAAASQGISSTVGWRSPDRETNDFYFNYYDDTPQILKVSRDNVVTKSTTKPIMIPGFGGPAGFGGLAGFGGIGGAGALRALATARGLGAVSGKLEAITGPLGAISGKLGETGGPPARPSAMSGVFSALISELGGAGGVAPVPSEYGGLAAAAGEMARRFLPGQTYSIRSDPQGGSTSGFLTLWNSPRLDPELAYAATGKRAAVGFSGNSYFHPFVWDAIHLFEFDYDEQGRVRHAWELDTPGALRLDFTWDGRRLKQITGRAATPGAPVVYTRTLQYAGEKLMNEVIVHNGKTSRIEYKYDKQGRLAGADCEDDHSLDGRSRQVEFLAEAAKARKR